MLNNVYLTQTTKFYCCFWICLVSSLELVEIDDPSETDIAKRLAKYLDDNVKQLPHENVKINDNGKEYTLNDDTEITNEEFPELSLFNAKKEDLNKVLVKRIVTHKKPLPFEHDFGPYTDYRPVVRVHKKRGAVGGEIRNTGDDKLQFLRFLRTNNKFGHANRETVSALNGNHENIDGSSSKRKPHEEIESGKEYGGHILKHSLSIQSPHGGRSLVDTAATRKLFHRSGEHYRPIVPRKRMSEPGHESTTEKTKWLPKYPFWNYWTYKKTIYQDECPGKQIAVGEICIWVPPH